MKKSLNTSSNAFQHKRQVQDKQLVLKNYVKTVEKQTGFSLVELKKHYSEEQLFYIALKYITTTKKALCMAFNIPVEAGCRYKRNFEKEGVLVQSIDEVFCPYTKHPAHLLSTNPNEFERLLKSNTNQLKMFE